MNSALDRAFRSRILLSCTLRPVFIVGASRAGTTYLQSLIGTHPEIRTAPETKLFQSVLRPYKRLTFDESYPQGSCRIPDLISTGQLETSLHHIREIGFLKIGVDVAEVLRMMAAEGYLDPCSFLNVLINNCVPEAISTDRIWVEKSPRHIFFLGEIFRFFPDARIICIYRDIVEQACSGLMTFDYPVFSGLLDGYRSYKAFEKYLGNNPGVQGRVHSVRYEELKDRPGDVLSGIFDFLGLQPVSGSDSLRQKSADSFKKIYGDTGMMAWQPGMDSGESGKRTDSRKRIKKNTSILLSLTSWDGKRFAAERKHSISEALSPGFLAFLVKHTAAFAAFGVKQAVKDVFVRTARAAGF